MKHAHAGMFARAENQLLVYVARRVVNATNEEKIHELVRTDLDWRYVLAMANRHGVIPLLYRELDSFDGNLPQFVVDELNVRNQEIFKSNLSLTAELVKLLDFFNAHDVVAIPFKGPTLALRAYGDIASRQFTDLDVLVRKSDVLRVRELFVNSGFKPQPELTRTQEAALLRFDCAYDFVNPQGVMIDVHWGFVGRHFSFEIDPIPLWDRLEPITIGSKQLLTPSMEDLLLILCLHGFTHFWERLGWICDVAALLERRRQIDWQLLMETAETMGGRRILSLGLLLANDLLHASLPQDVLKLVNADAEVNKVAKQVKQQLFLEPRRPAGIFTEAMLLLRLRERKRDKLRSFFSLLAQPRSGDWMFLSLPGSLFFLYYLIRPLRLAVKYAAQLPGLLRDHETAISRSLS